MHIMRDLRNKLHGERSTTHDVRELAFELPSPCMPAGSRASISSVIVP